MPFDRGLQFRPRSDTAAQDDQFGIDDAVDSNESGRDDARDFVDCGTGGLVCFQMVKNIPYRCPAPAAKPDIALNDGGAACCHLQCTDRMIARIEGIAAHWKIRDFTSPAARAPDHSTIGDKAHADSCPDGNE